jgi:hypothetical protein
MSSLVSDAKYVLDVVDRLQQSGGQFQFPEGMPPAIEVGGDATVVIRFGLKLAFESGAYWKSLPKKFIYTLWGHSVQVTTSELRRELREIMRPYKNKR